MNETVLFTEEDIARGYYPLRPFQKWIIDRNFHKAKSTMMNESIFMKIHPQIDLEKFIDAFNKVFDNHDTFRCRLVFHPENNELCQRFDGETSHVKVEEWSDEEFTFIKDFLAEPFFMINKPLYRIYIFKTPTANYFYGEVHHSIIDGVGVVLLLMREVDLIYKGKKIKTPVSYADFIADEMKIPREEIENARNYWREMLKNFGDEKHLPPCDLSEKSSWKKGNFFYEFKNITQEYFRDKGNSESYFYMAASMFAIAKTTNSKKSLMTGIHNGRTNSKEMRLFGLMIEQLPIAMDFSENISLKDFLKNLQKKMSEGINYRRGLDFVYDGGFEDNCATFIFQKKNLGVQTYLKFGDLPCEVEEATRKLWSAAQNTFDIEVTVSEDGKTFVELDYDTGNYSENAIKNFAETMDAIILKMQQENISVHEILEGEI